MKKWILYSGRNKVFLNSTNIIQRENVIPLKTIEIQMPERIERLLTNKKWASL